VKGTHRATEIQFMEWIIDWTFVLPGGVQKVEDNSMKFIEVNRDVTILRSAIEI